MKIYSLSAAERHAYGVSANSLVIPESPYMRDDTRFWQHQVIFQYRRARRGGLSAHLARSVVWHSMWIATSSDVEFWAQDDAWGARRRLVRPITSNT